MELDGKKQPFNREYREIIKKHRKTILEKALRADYKYTDSPLQGYRDGGAFEDSFRNVLPEGQKSLRDYIEQTLYQKKGNAVGIEFGGPGSKFFAGFSRGFFKKTAGVDIIGRRGVNETLFRGVGEMMRGHSVIGGDLLTPKTYADIRVWLGADNPDLIVERMMAGLDLNPLDPAIISKTFKRWYELLSENGLMFLQVPWAANTVLRPWADMLRRDYAKLLEVSHSPGNGHDGKVSDLNVLRLKKLPGAPKKLPQLEIASPEKSS